MERSVRLLQTCVKRNVMDVVIYPNFRLLASGLKLWFF